MIKVLRAGLYTSIQDMGRIGYRNLGVPLSGAMDSISASFANALLNNDKKNAVLEITMVGPKLEFLSSTTIVISGADMSPKLNNIDILNNKIYAIESGDIISFGQLKNGLRCYLAVSGGFQTENVLKSRSFYQGITFQGFLKKNDIIPFDKSKIKEIDYKGIIKNKTQFFETNIIEAFEGPEFNLFLMAEKNKMLLNTYSVSNQLNRMGYILQEKVIKHNKSIITSPVLPGTVQLIPDGKLIILMKDAQTTGGYPRVLQLTEKSIAIIAQKGVGDKFSFKIIPYNV
jgi:biotin-dependent carboxylase-like uncharacterized protein